MVLVLLLLWRRPNKLGIRPRGGGSVHICSSSTCVCVAGVCRERVDDVAERRQRPVDGVHLFLARAGAAAVF
jgi:hypothetical protein